MTSRQPNPSSASRADFPLLRGCAKVLEIGPYPPPYNGWSARIWVLKAGLEKAGHTCVALNLGEHRRIPSADYECVRSGWEYLCKLVRYARRGYVFHVHTNGDSRKGFLINLIAYVVTLLAGRRPILTLHAGTDQVYFPRKKSRLMVPWFKLLFGVAKAVICDNADVARRIIQYGIPAAKVFPICPFTKQYLDVPPQALGEKLEGFLQSHRPVVLTYLECRPEYDAKSLFHVIGELARQRPELGVAVTGATDGHETISATARAAGVGERCLHVGAIDHGQFLALLPRVSLFLRCNQREGTSASIREALHFGVPVVGNNSESQPEGVVVYPWGNADAMLQAAETVLASASLAPRPGTQQAAAELPDTVMEELQVLVR